MKFLTTLRGILQITGMAIEIMIQGAKGMSRRANSACS